MYEVYRSDRKDNTYLGNYYNYDNAVKPEESYSLSLLVSRNPVFKEATMAAVDSQSAQRKQMQGGKGKKGGLPEVNYEKKVVEALLHQTASDLIGFDEKVQKVSHHGPT